MLLLFYKSFPVIAQYLIYTSLNLTVPTNIIIFVKAKMQLFFQALLNYVLLKSNLSIN
ncbi:hypothetical protein [Rickettsia sp. MEAM1 (Bemisia tabaci)]|uniref:hypothetical protein n=1 Tax=Rickettsia sp. MEAM1 (Bemisia tabaci) TaxID=1182263 RepID=UPI0012FD193C|nr:hypothetical protein [Rickettsia sp. MEAM1 (Bemisia tabaci)]